MTSFGLIFVAELGDKTQLAVLAQTCKYRRPWAVLLGASLALIAVTALGAAGGRLVGRLVPPAVLRWGAAAAFVVMGALVAREAIKGKVAGEACLADEGEESVGASPFSPNWKAFAATFWLLFVAELGDKTQLAVLSMATKSAPWLVFIGGGLALTAVTALAVVGGEGLCRLISKRALLGVSAVAFVVMGVLMGVGVV
ncbi:MAG: TMEM165/GDT1 family protein [Anaerolineae bacterium]|nr:TMEM165/GDT1 family protein [Anaerolineae bacterium]